MIYTRGLPAEFDLWESMGNEGWRYRDMLPYFVRAENFIDRSSKNNSAWHGTKGPYSVYFLPLACSCTYS